MPFYYCVTADCLSEFKVTNGDVLFINSKKSAYVAGTTDVRVLANGYTSSMLAKFIKHSYAPNVVYISDEVLYQIFYKRQPAILVTLVNNANATNNKNILDQLSVELRGSILIVINIEEANNEPLNSIRIKKKLKFSRAFTTSLNFNIYTDTTPYVYLIDNSIVFKRYKKTLSTESGTGVLNLNNMLTFFNSWRSNSLTPEAITEPLPNYTALIADSTLSIVLPIVRSNYNSRVAGNANDIVVIYLNSNIDYSNTILLYFLEVAKYYSSRAPKMQFYSINLTLNELPELNIDDNSYLPAVKHKVT